MREPCGIVMASRSEVKLDAACQDGCASMHRYLCNASGHKPLSEVGAEAYLSEDHPRGELLHPRGYSKLWTSLLDNWAVDAPMGAMVAANCEP